MVGPKKARFLITYTLTCENEHRNSSETPIYFAFLTKNVAKVYQGVQVNICQKHLFSVNYRRYVFHFKPKPNIMPEKYLALDRSLNRMYKYK